MMQQNAYSSSQHGQLPPSMMKVTRSTPPSAGPAVLIVDDEPSNLKVLSDSLSGQGLALSVATSGERALEQIKRRLPDLILLDVLMPTMDGFEVCRQLKADPATQPIPIIFMTALHETADRIRAFELGAVDYLTKPFYHEELRARVKTQIHLRMAMKVLGQKNEELQKAQLESATMVEQLQQASRELERINETLDLEVSRRTEELLSAKEELERELEMRRHSELEREALYKRIHELSSPVIPISEQILVMPLIGIIDEERAERLVDSALQRMSQSGASVMILDITGVPQVNAEVARAIVDTARALRLLGAHTILTGIRPEVARTLLTVDVDLAGIVTQSTLQGGMMYAARILKGNGKIATR